MNKVFKNVVVAGLLAGAGFYASAQTTAPAAAAPQKQASMPGHGDWDPAKMREAMAKRHAEHMADFKTVLRITPNQESAWNTFATAMAPRPGAMAMHSPEERAKMRAEMEKLSTPERMDKLRALRTERQAKMNAEMDRRMAAVKTFYGVLTPEQQKVFDVTHKQMMERRMGHGMHNMMMRREGGAMMHHK
jgi:Spy/CpxP family protein refolding chaperone